jgi:transcriptional regulator with XRE-family HTH domain
MTTATKEFGRRLQAERERRGIPLTTIAETTKIKGSLLVDLERGDVSKWPRGIFRRAFVREYAAAIGLSPDAVAAEFFELFAEEGGAAAPRRAPERGGLRLTLAADAAADRKAAAVQVLVAALELGGVLAAGWAGAWLARIEPVTLIAIVGLTYYPLASACWGRTPALRWLHRRHEGALEAASGARGGAADLLRLLMPRPEAPEADVEATGIPRAPASGIQVASR